MPLWAGAATEVAHEYRQRHRRGFDTNLKMSVAGLRAAPWRWRGDWVPALILGIVVRLKCLGDAPAFVGFVHDPGFRMSAYESDVAYGYERDPVGVGVHGYLSLPPYFESSRQELCGRLELTCLACEDEWVCVWCE